MAKIYTKTGDQGTTSLIGGTRISKGELKIEAYGTVDELNSWIGMLRDISEAEARRELLKEIQDRLFTIGSEMASEPGSDSKKLPDLKEGDIELLELAIDEMNDSLPPLKHFVLPGGHQHVSFAHVARTVSRRAERCAIRLHDEEGLSFLIIKYLNRLSDYLFVLSRMMVKEMKAEEVKWVPRIS
ncbi:MAG: cob(I)alamin adenosyltransferase [Algoriphagus sp.]|jgi:cob(I)alamin adenosyltransferase